MSWRRSGLRYVTGVAKSNRRRKQDKAKAATRRATEQRRRERKARVRAAERRLALLRDPSVPAAQLAELLLEEYKGGPVRGWFARSLLEQGSSPDRLAEAARLLLADPDASPSLTALTFGASVAALAGDTGRERELIDRAIAATEDDLEVRLQLTHFILTSGYAADAIELLEPVVREDPACDWAAEQYGLAMEQAYEHVHQALAEGDAARERAALDRFADRSALVAMRDAVNAQLDRTEMGSAVRDRVMAELDSADDINWTDEDRSGFCALAEEVALLTVDPERDTLEAAGVVAEDDDAGTPLMRFAADPATPPALAVRAKDWHDRGHYGLWQLDDRIPAPGIWCTEILSATRRYVEFPPDAVRDLPRWTVWLGAIVPVDGVWRSTGTGMPLSPAEADAAAEYIQRVMLRFLLAAQGTDEPETSQLGLAIGRADPLGVEAGYEDASEPEVAAMYSRMTCATATGLASQIIHHRTAPPRLHNTDGDPMCLISATIKVTTDAVDKLIEHPDFDADEDDPGHVTWWGLEIPKDQAGPQRWLRGSLRMRDDELVAEVNSRARLDRLLSLLTELDADPVVTEERRIDPAQDFAWPAGALGLGRTAAAPAAEGIEHAWLNEEIPALLGNTPRQAAQGEERNRLEALLRQFEYDNDLLAASGQKGFDTAWLRDQLGMPSDLDD
jgi:hypothetical protein